MPIGLAGAPEGRKWAQISSWEGRVVMTASTTDDFASAERRIQELTQALSQAKGELVEAREQQAATGGILRVISSSHTDLQPVFAEIAMSAARLCDAYDAVIRQVDGEVLRIVGHHGPIPAAGTLPLTRRLPPARAKERAELPAPIAWRFCATISAVRERGTFGDVCQG
jgi:hypothetical protein